MTEIIPLADLAQQRGETVERLLLRCRNREFKIYVPWQIDTEISPRRFASFQQIEPITDAEALAFFENPNAKVRLVRPIPENGNQNDRAIASALNNVVAARGVLVATRDEASRLEVARPANSPSTKAPTRITPDLWGWAKICPFFGLSVGKDRKRPNGMDKYLEMPNCPIRYVNCRPVVSREELTTFIDSLKN